MAEELFAPLTHPFVLRGLLIAWLLGVACGVIGCFLLLRRLVLIADSFGHALLPGIGLAYLWLGPGHSGLYLGAAIAGLLTALISGLLQHVTRLPEDAAFAALFVLCFAVGLIILQQAMTPTDLLHYLFGDILASTMDDVWRTWAVASAVVLALCLWYRPLLLEAFDATFLRACGGRPLLVHLGVLFAVVATIVTALQAVGLVLALGWFVLPAAAAYLCCDRWSSMLLMAGLIGGMAASAGLLASWWLDWPSGPCMVAALGAVCLSCMVGGRHGLRARWRSARHDADESGTRCERT
ncbi:MAG: metal ABC transporter permease [Planctomycetota bacterium]|nr:metal ABC transporter permease [Planctomycetota bacterium]MDW8373011.1 metal ABC transporter permease [Planctomycetota bacterium]